MSQAELLIRGSAYDANTRGLLKDVFDTVWARIGGDYLQGYEVMEAARVKLAHFVLGAAVDGERDRTLLIERVTEEMAK
jgi:hypothetical protein